MVSARRDLDPQRVVDPFADLHPVPPPTHEEPSAWRPVSEQGILAALATLTTAGG
jgi:hypothetical protein